MGRQQQKQAHQQTEHPADSHAHRGDIVAGLPRPPGADVLGQEDGGGGTDCLQHDDDHVHHLVTVAHGGHGFGADAGEHELVHVAHQQLQQ